MGAWLDFLCLTEYKDIFIGHDVRGAELIHLERRDLKVSLPLALTLTTSSIYVGEPLSWLENPNTFIALPLLHFCQCISGEYIKLFTNIKKKHKYDTLDLKGGVDDGVGRRHSPGR